MLRSRPHHVLSRSAVLPVWLAILVASLIFVFRYLPPFCIQSAHTPIIIKGLLVPHCALRFLHHTLAFLCSLVTHTRIIISAPCYVRILLTPPHPPSSPLIPSSIVLVFLPSHLPPSASISHLFSVPHFLPDHMLPPFHL
ncbi:hypothetical protein PYCCODRAFT_944539 [Trametes coccinea BRFM310]|uniref:Uncharacterized protein n=1 Tax=Trametes coccinea (strain BRFM310) TaxID=1353009 RepID=A0A1Y2J262_TRAC3|nr:hypothetical protein PYCCODRAFT_944539 [Trametes coccinea BRFM310]